MYIRRQINLLYSYEDYKIMDEGKRKFYARKLSILQPNRSSHWDDREKFVKQFSRFHRILDHLSVLSSKFRGILNVILERRCFWIDSNETYRPPASENKHTRVFNVIQESPGTQLTNYARAKICVIRLRYLHRTSDLLLVTQTHRHTCTRVGDNGD